ncbi:MAG: CARDB domain-containing protein [Phycisphaerae bacterium]
MRTSTISGLCGVAVVLAIVAAAPADTLELNDGQKIENCYVRDEGVRLTVWHNLADVGGPPRIYPRSQVKSWQVDRGEDWDRRPDQPDLTVTFIEITPKLASLHGRIQYDEFGRAWIGGDSKLLVDMGDRKFVDPEGAARNLKLHYEPGEELTLTAHVKNIGFRGAAPFEVEWRIDDQVMQRDQCADRLAEMAESTFTMKWPWQDGQHHVTVRIVTDQPEIATINNEATDALWAWPFTFTVCHGRVDAWHQFRSAYGTFSFEDFYRWHVDIMNLLFAASIYPAAPEGIKARVRLDRIIYADSVRDHTPYFDGKEQSHWARDGIRYDQGGWGWDDRPEELDKGEWVQIDHTWRNQTEWSLPHELGHQLGLVDWYAIDYPGHENHVWPDNGEKVTHFMRFPLQMMHWHGPQLYGEVDACYFNMTIDKPRGYFGDMYFTNPAECFIHVVDLNGQDVPDAEVEIFQRGTVVDPDQPGGEDHGVRYAPIVEDGNFYEPPVSKLPVAVGKTDRFGVMRLPNRPAAEVRTLTGFHRTNNPFGNMNVVGPRNLLLVKVTHHGRVCYYWLEGHEFVLAWFRGFRDKYVTTLPTPYGSVDSPPAPQQVQVTRVDEHHVKVTWEPGATTRERNYLDDVGGYRVYRRIGNSGLKDRPWFAVATLDKNAREFVVDLREFPEDFYWFKPQTLRFGVTTIGTAARQSELVETLLAGE